MGKRFFLSPAGAALTLICFFLPWGRFSCLAVHKSLSGAQIGGAVWWTFCCALVILTLGSLLIVLRRLSWARVLILACSLAGFLAMALRAIQASRGIRTPLGYVQPSRVGTISIQVGGIGTIVGLLLALIGGVFLIQTTWTLRRGGLDRVPAPQRAMTPGRRAAWNRTTAINRTTTSDRTSATDRAEDDPSG